MGASKEDLVTVEEAIAALSQPGPEYTSKLFAFAHAAAAETSEGSTRDRSFSSAYDAGFEYGRMGVETPANPVPACPWSLSVVNRDYTLCSTYPAWLVEPRSVQEMDLRTVANFRKRGRIPTMSWCGGQALGWAALWRSSQSTEGLFNKGCPEDEQLVRAIRQGAPAGKSRDLLVIDLRPVKAAYANKVGGGGFEGYDGCRLIFGGIDNVHGVRDGWKAMTSAVSSLNKNEVGSWLKDVANSGWFDIIGAVMQCALEVVTELPTHRCCALIHCSDGWDRTAQVAATVMLCMDQQFRTVSGLLRLIQKEFCSFGHQFRTRMGNGVKPSSEYSPIFTQWLECIYQLTVQFPTAFEFTPALLLFLAREVTSNRYGTFLTDSEKERQERVNPHTLSLWTVILAGPSGDGPAPEYVNADYCRVEDPLRISPSQVNFKVWDEYWFAYSPFKA